jgi:protochlorophyllide reductase
MKGERSMAHWNIDQIPDQTGRVVVITGANIGLGFESALALARKRARIVTACRNLQKCAMARSQILEQVPGAEVDVLLLDLSSLDSVNQFVDQFCQRYNRLDILMNNAGIMAAPHSRTAEGFELHFGVNHLAHFALTGLLLDRLLATPHSRVVTVYSAVEMIGRINFNDLQLERFYNRWLAYAQSKLANLYFAWELQRKLIQAGSSSLSVAAHPGFASTNLQTAGLQSGKPARLQTWFMKRASPLAQNAAQGALSQLYAATNPEVIPGGFYGPQGLFQSKGNPIRVIPRHQPQERISDVERLWKISVKLTGVKYNLITQ